MSKAQVDRVDLDRFAYRTAAAAGVVWHREEPDPTEPSATVHKYTVVMTIVTDEPIKELGDETVIYGGLTGVARIVPDLLRSLPRGHSHVRIGTANSVLTSGVRAFATGDVCDQCEGASVERCT